MSFTTRGRVLRVEPSQQISDKLTKQILILEIASNPMYPQQVGFEFINDRITQLNGLHQYQDVEVSFDIQGRDYEKNGETKNYTSLKGWLVKTQTNGGPNGQPAGGYVQQAAPQQMQPQMNMMAENQGGYTTTHQAPPPPQQFTTQQPTQQPVNNVSNGNEMENDLPF